MSLSDLQPGSTAGAGKYGGLAEMIVQITGAKAVCLIVLDAELGSGMSLAQRHGDKDPLDQIRMAKILHTVANEIEKAGG